MAIIDPTKPPITLEEKLGFFQAAIRQRFEALEAEVKALSSDVLNLSQALAEKEHGVELVRRALDAATAEGKLPELVRTHHPYDELVTWFKQHMAG